MFFRLMPSSGHSIKFIIFIVSFLLLACSVNTGVNHNAAYNAPPRSVPSISEKIGKRIIAVSELLQPTNSTSPEPKKALQTLFELQKEQGMNAYEQAVIEQYLGYAYLGLENYTQAVYHLEKCLSFSPSIPIETEVSTYRIVSQLYFQIEKSDQALKNLLKWKDYVKQMKPEDSYSFATIYYTLDDKKNALHYINEAIAKKKEQSQVPLENWYLLKKGILIDSENYAEAAEVNNELIKNYPSDKYLDQAEKIRIILKKQDLLDSSSRATSSVPTMVK